MTVSIDASPDIVTGAQSIALSQLVHVSSSGTNPSYLVLNGLDRDEYTSASSGTTGTFNGNGTTVGLTTSNGDARENGIVFTYQPLTGRYFSSSVGYLDQLTYTTSASKGDVTDLSLFGFSSLSQANAYASDAYSLMYYDPAGFIGSTTIATLPSFTAAVPSQATPNSIAAIADSFVGQSWNMDGCWVLTSTIAAEAGAALSIQSTMDIAGQANGEWIVAYNGPAGATGNWQSQVRTGDMIGFITSSGGGHITTCVSGSGSSAELVDNITYVNSSGAIVNSANDGSSSDVIIAAPHAASQEFAGVSASSVVIYRLDTPVVTAAASQITVAQGNATALAAAFSAADPAGRSVTEVQAYVSNGSDVLSVNGTTVDAMSAATAATAGSLSQLALTSQTTTGTDTLTVRAFNGLFWGDWTSITVDSSATAAEPGAAANTGSAPQMASISSNTVESGIIPVFRFFDQADGTHFFTAGTAERDQLIASRPDLTYEGVGLNALSSPSTDTAAEPVYRFFDQANGTHFFTASGSEQANLIANGDGYSYEGVAFYEDATQQAGDVPVYRFYETTNGTHLYTDSASERSSLLATRPDLVLEGVAFYAPS